MQVGQSIKWEMGWELLIYAVNFEIPKKVITLSIKAGQCRRGKLSELVCSCEVHAGFSAAFIDNGR